MPASSTLLSMAMDPVNLALAVGKRPDDWQARLLRSTEKEILLNVSRQGGKSTFTSILAVYEALFTPRSLTLIFSPTLRQSRELFLKIKFVYHAITGQVGYWKDRETSLELNLSNNNRIVALPGDKAANIRGYSEASLILFDEASHVLDELYYACRPMVAVSGGRLVGMTTPHGRIGWFYEEWANGGPEWQRYEVPATMIPRITSEYLAKEKRRYPLWFYLQEYCCQFTNVDSQVFLFEDIEAMFNPAIKPMFERMVRDYE